MTLIYLLDKDQNVQRIVDNIKSGTETNKINASNELDVDFYYSPDLLDLIDSTRYIAIPAHNSTDKVHLYNVEKYSVSYDSVSVSAYETIFDEFKDTWVGKIWGILYVDELLEQLIDTLPFKKTWHIGASPDHASYEPQGYQDEDVSASDVIRKAIDNWGFEFDFTFNLSKMKITDRYINVYEKIGTDQKKLRFDMKRDFKDVKYTKDYSGIYTALVGYGSEYEVDNTEAPHPNEEFVDYFVSGTVKIIVPSAQMVNRQLKPYSGRTLALDSEWRTDMYIYRESDKSKFFRVSTDQYVSSTACTFNGNDDNNSSDNSSTETGKAQKFITDFSQVEWTAGENPVNKPKGQGYVEVQGATEAYGYTDGTPRIGFAKFSDESSSERLLGKTYLKLLTICYPTIQFESGFNNFPDNISLGDTIYLYEENLKIYVEERITEMKIDLVDINSSTLTVGKTFAVTPEERYLGISDYAKSNYKKYS